MSLLPALEESEKTSSHGWSAAGRFGADMDNSQSNLYHQLISQNNTGDVPDALAEEEIYEGADESPMSVAYNQHQQTNSQTSVLKQQLLQKHQHQQAAARKQQHVNQQVKNYIQQHHHQQQQQQQPQPSTPKQQSMVYSIVTTSAQASPQLMQSGNQQMLNNAGRQTTAQLVPQQNVVHAGIQKPKVVNYSQSQLPQQPQQPQQQQPGYTSLLTDKVETEEEMNYQLQVQQKVIEENNRRLAQYGMPTLSVSPQSTPGKCDYPGTVKVQNSQNLQSPQQSTNNMRQLLLINNEQANNRKMGIQVVNNNGANVANTVHQQTLSPQTAMTSAGGMGNSNQIVIAGQRTNNQVSLKGNSLVLNQTPMAPPRDPLAGEVSREKVTLEGGGQFQEGQAYMIQSKDGTKRTMMLKNGKFVPYDPEKGIIQHSAIDSSQRGRGRGRGKSGRGRGNNLHGNATGVNMVQNSRGPVQGARPPSNQQVRAPMVARDSNMRSNLNNIGRQDFLQLRGSTGVQRQQMPNPGAVVAQTSLLQVGPRGPVKPQQQRPPIQLQNLMPPAQGTVKAVTTTTLVRRPLHPDQEAEEGTTNDQEAPSCPPPSDVSVPPAEPAEKVQAEKQDLPNIPTDPNTVAICQFCGYQSEDKIKCIRCNRRFTSATKFISLVKVNTGTVSSDAKRRKLEVTVKKTSGGRGGISKKVFYSNKLEEQNQIYTRVIQAANNGKTVLRTTRMISRGQGNRRMRGRGRARGIIVPETVTISSDEEEEESGVGGTKLELGQAPGPTPSTPQASQGSTSSSECPESPLIPTIPISTQRNITRVGKMEDEQGASRESRERSLSPNVPAQLLLNARVVRVGTLKGSPIEPILVNQEGFSFCIEDPKGSHRFQVYPQDIQQCLVNFDESSFVFFLTNTACGERTRASLGIPNYTNPQLPPPEPYFDPTGMYMPHQMIMMVLEKLDPKVQLEFQKHMDIFKTYGKQGDESFYMELNAAEASDLLKQISRKTPMPQIAVLQPQQQQSPAATDQSFGQQTEEGKQSRSPSPHRMGFVGTVVKLLTYPPPPSKGALSITNEDLFCLQEGEFLNDVIIDFYLKYLLLEKLSEEDRSRTHIFSSFFYKRLTQRIRGAVIDDDPSLSLAVKRHARVKRWTRHVDLFQKDFIIVPINEHSHWFLAIICFPGLGEPTENRYIPKPIGPALPEPTNAPTPPQPTEDAEHEDMETEESEAEANASAATEKHENTSEPPTSTTTEDEVGKEDTLKTESNPTEKEKGEQEEKTVEPQEEEKGPDSTETVNETKDSEVTNGSEECKSEEVDTSQSETKESDSAAAEDKDKTDTPNDSEAAKAKTAVTATTTAAVTTTSTSCGTSTSSRSTTPTSTSSASVGTGTTGTTRQVMSKLGSRGKTVTKEEEEKLETVAFSGIKQPCIMVFDSLSGPPRSRIVQVLKEYLQVEWSTKIGGELNKSTIKGCVPKVPQQNNYSDCGIYLLQYVESFFEDPIQDFTIPIRGLHDWFSINKITGKREAIHDLIIELKEKFENPSENKGKTS